MRSCAMATASPLGRTEQWLASHRRLSAGTFSNSVVTYWKGAHLGGGAIWVGIEHGDPKPHTTGGLSEHAAKLAAADQAKGITGLESAVFHGF